MPLGAPDLYGDPPWALSTAYDERECGGRLTQDYLSYSVLDLTGDGLSDLVLFRDDCTDPVGTGRDRWQVFAAECEVATP